MTNDAALIEKLDAIMAKARRSLVLAKEHHAKGFGDEAASKAYYAVFHVVQAALLTKGLAFSKHSGVKEGFNREWPMHLTQPQLGGNMPSRGRLPQDAVEVRRPLSH